MYFFRYPGPVSGDFSPKNRCVQLYYSFSGPIRPDENLIFDAMNRIK